MDRAIPMAAKRTGDRSGGRDGRKDEESAGNEDDLYSRYRTVR